MGWCEIEPNEEVLWNDDVDDNEELFENTELCDDWEPIESCWGFKIEALLDVPKCNYINEGLNFSWTECDGKMEGLLAVVDVSGIEFDLTLIVDVDVELDGDGESFEGAFGGFEVVIVDIWEFVSDTDENGEFEVLV